MVIPAQNDEPLEMRGPAPVHCSCFLVFFSAESA